MDKDADPLEKVKEFLKSNDLASIGEKVKNAKKGRRNKVKLFSVPGQGRRDSGTPSAGSPIADTPIAGRLKHKDSIQEDPIYNQLSQQQLLASLGDSMKSGEQHKSLYTK